MTVKVTKISPIAFHCPKSDDGWTALMLAEEGGLTEIVEGLKKAGAEE